MHLKSTLGIVAATVLLSGQHATGSPADEATITCPVVADATVYATSGNERFLSESEDRTLQALGSSAWVVLKFDLSALQDRVVTKATLRVYRSKEFLVRTGVSTVATEVDWVECTESSASESEHDEHGHAGHAHEGPQAGAVCFAHAAYASNPRLTKWWGPPGGDLSSVTFGQGGSRWKTVIPRIDGKSGQFDLDIPTEFVQAMAQGTQSPALVLTDDFGRSETTIHLQSRESSRPPTLIVETRPRTARPSAAPTALRVRRDDLGREWVDFDAPDAIGFEVYLSETPARTAADLARATRAPLPFMPTPGGSTRSVLLSFVRNARHRHVAVRAVDSGAEPSAVVSTKLDKLPSAPAPLGAPTLRRVPIGTLPKSPFLLSAEVALSQDGRWMQCQGASWWDPQQGPVTLESGRNEFVAFQVMLAGGSGRYVVTLADWESPGAAQPAIESSLFKEEYVRSRLGVDKYAPDPLTPLAAGAPLDLTFADPVEAAQPTGKPPRRVVVQGVWVDLYVPHRAARGRWRTRVVVVKDGRAVLDVPLIVDVVDAQLPDRLSFPVSLQSPRMPGDVTGASSESAEAWALYDACQRLAHAHRLTFAPLPYRPNGEVVAGFAPRIDVSGAVPRVDWTDWDNRFERYLSGSAFRDLPREAVPVDHFILPFHENWPMYYAFETASAKDGLAFKYHFRTTYREFRRGRSNPPPNTYMRWPPADAFTDTYRTGTAQVAAQFAAHLDRASWSETDFIVLPTNIIGQAKRSSWWQLRNPRVYDDVLGLRFLLDNVAMRLPDRDTIKLAAVLGDAHRARDTLDGVADRLIVNETFLDQHTALFGRSGTTPVLWFRSRENRPESGWATLLRSAWVARIAGATGLVVPDCLGEPAHWETAADRALIYPDRVSGNPLPSIRLKTLRRAQQDFEWLNRYLVQQREAGIPAGIALASVGVDLAQRLDARVRPYATLLPLLDVPARVDTIGFEELRRGLRRAAAGSTPGDAPR